jgi:acetyltransferase
VLANPLDLTVAPAEDFGSALDALLPHDVADMFLLIFGDPIHGACDTAVTFRERAGRRVAVAYLGGGEVEKEERVRLHAAGIPTYPTPERAAAAMATTAWAARRKAEIAEKERPH